MRKFGVIFLCLSAIALIPPTIQADENAEHSVALSLQNAFGARAGEIKNRLSQVQLSDKAGRTPEDIVRPGDIIVYPKLHNDRRQGGDNEIGALPSSYYAGMRGFTHAGMVAKRDSGQPYILESPRGSARCEGEFRGLRPYFVLRPRMNSGANSAAFERNVNRLANAFDRAGYEYSSAFQTSIFRWTQEDKSKFKYDLERWSSGHSKYKPEIPNMYCSELVATIHSLLGILQRRSVSMNELIDMGIASEVAQGKSRETIVQETTSRIRSSLITGYTSAINESQYAIDSLVTAHGPKEDIEKFRKQIEDLKARRNLMTDLMEAFENALRSHIGMPLKPDSNPNCNRTLLDKVKSYAKGVLNRILPVIYNVILSSRIVRPADFIIDATSGDQNRNYELVGYYPGGLPTACR